MLKVLHIVPAAPFGGAQRLVVDLAAKQKARGAQSQICFISPSDGSAQLALDAAREAGVSATTLVGSKISLVLELRKMLGGSGFSVVHLHVPPPWIFPAISKGREYALVSHLHTRPILAVHEATLKRRLDSFATQRIMRSCDRLIAISGWISSAWREHDARLKPTIVYNGINLAEKAPDRDRPKSRREFTVGMASRLSDRKGVEEFLQLAATLKGQLPEARFLIAGDGPFREMYERNSRELGLADCLSFQGFVQDMAGFWAQLDLAAFTPPFEPFGLRLIEPLVGGVPVIGYRTGTGGDEVMDLCRGVEAVPYGDVDGLAELAISLSRDTEKREKMARDGFADIQQHFSLDVMTDGVEKVYEAAMREKQATKQDKAPEAAT